MRYSYNNYPKTIYHMKNHNLKNLKLICSLIVLLSFNSCSKDTVLEDDTTALQSMAIATNILDILNSHRANIGKNALLIDGLANDLAVEHTLYMIEKNTISHDNFNARSERLFAEAQATRTGENVAFGQPNATAVMEAWLGSQGHRNIIEGDFTHIGIAALKNPNGTYFYTQIFLKKKNGT